MSPRCPPCGKPPFALPLRGYTRSQDWVNRTPGRSTKHGNRFPLPSPLVGVCGDLQIHLLPLPPDDRLANLLRRLAFLVLGVGKIQLL